MKKRTTHFTVKIRLMQKYSNTGNDKTKETISYIENQQNDRSNYFKWLIFPAERQKLEEWASKNHPSYTV